MTKTGIKVSFLITFRLSLKPSRTGSRPHSAQQMDSSLRLVTVNTNSLHSQSGRYSPTHFCTKSTPSRANSTNLTSGSGMNRVAWCITRQFSTSKADPTIRWSTLAPSWSAPSSSMKANLLRTSRLSTNEQQTHNALTSTCPSTRKSH